MLIRQFEASEGEVTAATHLTTRLVFNSVTTGECFSGIVLDNAGVAFTKKANNGNSQITGEWLIAGTPGDFYVQRTVTQGSLTTDPGSGFLQLNATRTYSIRQIGTGDRTTIIFLEISDDAGGTNVVASATITMFAQVEE